MKYTLRHVLEKKQIYLQKLAERQSEFILNFTVGTLRLSGFILKLRLSYLPSNLYLQLQMTISSRPAGLTNSAVFGSVETVGSEF
jgi:hypothetical protein